MLHVPLTLYFRVHIYRCVISTVFRIQVRLVLTCVFGPVNIVLAVIIWWRIGFLLFNTIGSNEELNSEATYDLREGLFSLVPRLL